MKVQGVPTDDRDMAKMNVVRDRFVRQYLFTRPLVDAHRTWTGTPKIGRKVVRFAVVRPINGQFAI